MKKLVLSWLLLLVACVYVTAATNKDAVTLVAYEQSWMDSEGTLAVRNNTDKSIAKIVFQLIYLDMENNPLDYEEFTRRVEIAPHMVKKLDVPGYESDRHYHFYRTKGYVGVYPQFKIKFKLLACSFKDKGKSKIVVNSDGKAQGESTVIGNPVSKPTSREVSPVASPKSAARKVKADVPAVSKAVVPVLEKDDAEEMVNRKDESGDERNIADVLAEDDEQDVNGEVLLQDVLDFLGIDSDLADAEGVLKIVLSYVIFAFILILVGIGITVGLYMLVVVMAQSRHRNIPLWVFLSLFITPILSIVILLLIGKRTSEAWDE